MDILGLVLINEEVGVGLKYLMIFYPMTLSSTLACENGGNPLYADRGQGFSLWNIE